MNLQLILSLRGISIVYNKTAEELTINLWVVCLRNNQKSVDSPISQNQSNDYGCQIVATKQIKFN